MMGLFFDFVGVNVENICYTIEKIQENYDGQKNIKVGLDESGYSFFSRDQALIQ